MKDYQLRVVDEHKELSDKFSKLKAYIKANPRAMDITHYRLLNLQMSTMETYLQTLEFRIELFKEENKKENEL